MQMSHVGTSLRDHRGFAGVETGKPPPPSCSRNGLRAAELRTHDHRACATKILAMRPVSSSVSILRGRGVKGRVQQSLLQVLRSPAATLDNRANEPIKFAYCLDTRKIDPAKQDLLLRLRGEFEGEMTRL
jgi:hypothetical protein